MEEATSRRNSCKRRNRLGEHKHGRNDPEQPWKTMGAVAMGEVSMGSMTMV